MIRSRILVVLGAAALALAAPSAASAKSCGSVKGVGGGTTVTNVSTSSGSCPGAKSVAKAYARSNGTQASGYTCDYTTAADNSARRSSYRVTCTRDGRKVAFKVRYAGLVLLPARPALPRANG